MPQKRVKLKLKSSAKKPLMIIGAILLIIVILLAFYFNRIGELKNLGYSEESAKSIIFKFKYSYVMDIGENKTLDKAFSSEIISNKSKIYFTIIEFSFIDIIFKNSFNLFNIHATIFYKITTK